MCYGKILFLPLGAEFYGIAIPAFNFPLAYFKARSANLGFTIAADKNIAH